MTTQKQATEQIEEVERLLDQWIDVDPDRCERWMESKLAQLALRKRAKKEQV
jgi:hypothetical protein